MNATLIATIGPAGAGKTTWRQRHAPADATVVSLDENRAALSPCGCSSDHTVNAAALEAGFATTRTVLAAGGTVVWDVTNYLAPFRTRLLALAADYQARTVGLVVLPPLDAVLAQNRRHNSTRCPVCGTARRVPEPVVRAMHQAITDALPRLHTEGWHELFLALPAQLHTS